MAVDEVGIVTVNAPDNSGSDSELFAVESVTLMPKFVDVPE